jgi:hypothetical protein
MKFSVLIFKGVILLFMIGVFSSCLTPQAGLKSHMRQFELVKAEESPEQNRLQEELVFSNDLPVEEQPVIPAVVLTVSEAIGDVRQDEPEFASLSVNRLQKAAINRAIRGVERQLSGLAGGQHTISADRSGAGTTVLHELAQKDRKEFREEKSNKKSLDLLRLILYILVAFLIITILGILFKGYLFTIAVLVLLILGVMYLMGLV